MKSSFRLVFVAITGAAAAVLSADPATTRPADPAMDFMLGAATRPATQPAEPATQPADPPLVNQARREDFRPAVLTLSDGRTVRGQVATTPDKPIRIWDQTIKDYRDIPLHLIRSATAEVVWERDEPEWTFRESGSDVKVHTGKTYPARETRYVVTLLNEETITGGIVAPLYWESGNQSKTYVLHKRAKGEVGQKLAELVYVKKIEFNVAE